VGDRPAKLPVDEQRVDDCGLKPLRAPGAEDLYDVINKRYEKGSIASMLRGICLSSESVNIEIVRSLPPQPERRKGTGGKQR